MNPQRIRVIAICLFRTGDKILVFKGFDSVKETYFYRPLGGGIEPGETSEEAIVREIHEELGQDIVEVSLLGVLENLFVNDGMPGHEIVFVYDAKFADKSLYDNTSLTGHEDNGDTLEVTWRGLDSFNDVHRLVPDDLVSVMQK